MENYIMSLDQGTSSVRCIIFNRAGDICSIAQEKLHKFFPEPGWVEQDPMELWNLQVTTIRQALEKGHIKPEQIAGIGVTNQRETTIVWDKTTGQPVYQAIVWQCQRTAERIEELRGSIVWDLIPERTGLRPDAYFSASKLEWILDHVEGVRERAERGELLFGTVDSWIIWNLTGKRVHITDYTNASRTMLFDIHKVCWDQEILDAFRIPACMLPEVKGSSHLYGYTDSSVFGGEIPVCGAVGDQQSALFGQSCFSAGEAKITYGTGCFMLMHTGRKMVKSGNGLLTTIAASADHRLNYALEGSIFYAGAALQWLRDSMGLIGKSKEADKSLDAVDDTNGIYVVPAFTGLGAPYWNSTARGMAVGLTAGAKKEHFIRATMESIIYQTQDVLEAIKQDAPELDLSMIRVDGGVSNSDELMQFLSDISRTKIVRPASVETTALGAAYLAGLAVGYWDSLEDIKNNWKGDTSFQPKMDMEESANRYKGWKRAVRAALSWAEDEV